MPIKEGSVVGMCFKERPPVACVVKKITNSSIEAYRRDFGNNPIKSTITTDPERCMEALLGFENALIKEQPKPVPLVSPDDF